MSYSDKYILHFGGGNGFIGTIHIQKDEFVGTPITLKLDKSGIKINYNFQDWFNPIINQTCSLSIINDASNFYEYEDLMELDEKEFKIIVNASDAYNNNIELFNGFINSETIETRYLQKSTFKLTGSNYITKLTNVHPPLVDTKQKIPFINIINQAISQTGRDVSIYILNRLEPSTSMADNQTLFNYTGVDTEIFWDNNVTRQNSYDILESSLMPFDSYLFPWNGAFYIVRYADAWRSDGSMNYVAYSNKTDYTPQSAGNIISLYEPSSDINDHLIIDRSQTLSRITVLKTIDVKLYQK